MVTLLVMWFLAMVMSEIHMKFIMKYLETWNRNAVAKCIDSLSKTCWLSSCSCTFSRTVAAGHVCSEKTMAMASHVPQLELLLWRGALTHPTGAAPTKSPLPYAPKVLVDSLVVTLAKSPLEPYGWWVPDIRRENQLREVGSWNPIIYDGF